MPVIVRCTDIIFIFRLLETEAGQSRCRKCAQLEPELSFRLLTIVNEIRAGVHDDLKGRLHVVAAFFASRHASLARVWQEMNGNVA